MRITPTTRPPGGLKALARAQRAPGVRPVAILALVLSSFGTFAVSGAQASSSYNTLLASSTIIGDQSVSATEGPGYVYYSQPWTAPNGMQYNGFAYTAATFSSGDSNGAITGGVSVGFLGTGGS